jgi:hypothetical protein
MKGKGRVVSESRADQAQERERGKQRKQYRLSKRHRF